MTRPRSALRSFLTSEAAGGVALMVASALALVLANVPGTADAYFHALHLVTGPVIGARHGPMTIHLWINDAAMAVFFLLVGLEIKRELVDGRLATWEQRRLPVIGAVAGMALPAAIYLMVGHGTPGIAQGWAIPAATDIAFAVGVMALLGRRVPAALKLFLTTLAIVDDMGAVIIIALAYTSDLDPVALGGAAVVLATMVALNRGGTMRLTPYLLLAVLLWYCVFLSGIHATVAGVLAAMTIPVKPTPGAPEAVDSPLHRLEHILHPWVAFAIVPLFGFVNAGVAFVGLPLSILWAPLPLAVAAGLFVGKQVGVLGAVWLAVRTGIAGQPGGAGWVQLWGIAALAGIGFTMSLFIGGLAFAGNAAAIDQVKIGVLAGSVLSALLGAALLGLTGDRSRRPAASR
ncbi:Na+/H+ antiporter NhaA [Sphingomonas sp. CFBP 13720]|uniref:Na+/H+ antiporter NhaA n=1 Tax=Sphingomonas sp. CFBP 13720 TaxID=2775302 RepID=UPI00177E8DC8|nr:Na+/H+ antiporter NhaA [Sphingomonas sp. CFBP 13720]MBD8679797.1 Na+/H+ antiporter NhaA [Sphingomonas sp. CFBP 13720]